MADSTRIEELKRRVQLDPASIAFAALAEEYRRAGQFEESISTCQAGLLRHPAYLSARVTLGRSLIELGRYDEARVELEHVLKAAPENLAAIRGLAEIHHRGGEIPETVPETLAEEPPAPPPAAVEPPHASAQPRAPIPIRPVQVASLTSPESTEAAGFAQVSASAPATVEDSRAEPLPARPTPPPPATPIALKPRPVDKREHPDAAALPALEALLARIVRARQSLAGTATDR